MEFHDSKKVTRPAIFAQFARAQFDRFDKVLVVVCGRIGMDNRWCQFDLFKAPSSSGVGLFFFLSMLL